MEAIAEEADAASNTSRDFMTFPRRTGNDWASLAIGPASTFLVSRAYGVSQRLKTHFGQPGPERARLPWFAAPKVCGIDEGGVCKPWATAGLTAEQLRDKIDSLVSRGIIRRGLVLGCSVCRNLAFVTVGDLGQRNRCPRCGAVNELARAAWRLPAGEPTWFYDLHQVARDLHGDNGHAPLSLSGYLSDENRRYNDVAEMELVKPGSRSSAAECDLVSLADRRLLTAEVKTTNQLATTKPERGRAARKRVLWAAVLRADEILLATTQPSWEKTSVDAVRSAILDATHDKVWAPGHEPSLTVVTNLGNQNVASQSGLEHVTG